MLLDICQQNSLDMLLSHSPSRPNRRKIRGDHPSQSGGTPKTQENAFLNAPGPHPFFSSLLHLLRKKKKTPSATMRMSLVLLLNQ